MIVYAFCSMGLAVLTEILAGGVIYLISRLLGKTYRNLGMPRPSPDLLPDWSSRSQQMPGYQQITRFDRRTIYAVLLIIMIATISLFIIYFLLLSKRIIRDMSYISDNITHIATGNMTDHIEIGPEGFAG